MASNSSAGNNKQLLSAWGLPQPILEAFHRKGLKQLYPWQAAALECAAAGNNLVYTAPTSGGKSLVADVLMLSRLHETQQALLAKAGPQKNRKPQQQPVTRALIVLPYLSIVSEKTAHLSKLLEAAKWRVMGYKGDDADGQPLVHPAERISICSIEKANGAINRMIQEGRLAELVSVTIDEAHMLSDENRGAALEMLLSKLVASRGQCSVQIVAMSATMSGLDSLSTWLDAHLFLTNFRPVLLAEHAVFEGTVFAKADRRQLAGADAEADSILQEQRSLEGAGKNDRESLVALVTEVAAEGHSVLVFCAGRAASQSCAEVLSKELPKRLGPPSADAAAARAELIESLRIALSGSTEAAFEKLLAAGVAYHHAGLTNQERSVVEQGFSSGALLVLTATSTLAAGVNLPARRVILRSLWQGVGDVSRAQYLQMVGRAGRAGHSAVGEAFLMARGSAHASSGEWGKVCKLLAAPLPVLQSQLVKEPPPAAAVHRKPPRSRAAAAAAAPGSTQTPQQPQEHENLASSLAVDSETQSGSCSTLPQTCGRSASGRVGALSGGGVRRGAAGAAAGTQQPAQQPEVDAAAQSRLQHLLLDAFATELATTGESVQQLLQSTLAFFHVPWNVLVAAAHAALSALRARRLTTLLPDMPEKPSHWKLTPLGRAVVASALDPGTGLKLYSRLDRMRCCMVLGSHVQLLYVLQTSSALTIFDWSVWNRFMKQLSPQQRRVAEVEGIDASYIDRRIGGQPGNPISDEQHGRFAAAVLLDWLVADVNSMQLLEAAWGKPNSLTKAGISRGMLQKWQAEVSKTAAMAALLAAEAEWWQLETLLAPLAAQIAAGVRPELLPLMKVPGMQPSHAAALHAAGLGHPDLLLCASEGEVAAALAAGLPANMRKRKKQLKDKQGLAVSLTGNPGTNAMVARAARSVLAAARQHAVLAAASVVQGEDCRDEGEQATHLDTQQQQLLPPVRTKVLMGQATVHQVWPRKSDPLLARLLDAWQLQPSFALALILQEQHCAAAAAAAAFGGSSGGGSSGASVVHCGTVSGQQEQQQQLLQGGAKGVGMCAGMHGPVPSALVLCWSDKEAIVLHLPPVPTHSSSAGSGANASGGRRRSSRAAAAAAAGSAGSNVRAATAAAAAAAAAGDETAQWVWSVIHGILGDPCRTVTCAGAVQVLAALSAIGVSVTAVVDDPCAAFLLWQPQGLDHAAAAAGAAGAGGGGQQQPAEQEQQPWALARRAAKAASAVVLGGAFKLQVPLLPGSSGAAATAAAKSALLARALMPPLRALLAKQQLSAEYESVEQPLLRAFAEMRSGGVCVNASSLQQQLQVCDWQTQVLQQRLSQLMGNQQQQQQQQVQQQEAQPFGAQAVASVSDSDIRVFVHQLRLLNISHERLQQLPLLQLLQLAGRGAVKRHYTAILPLLRLLLTYCLVQQHQQQLQQLLRQYIALPAARSQEQQVGGGADNSSSSSRSAAGCVVLQPHPGLEPITGQVAAGWPAGLEGLLGLASVPALPVLTSATNLAQQGFKSLQGAVTVAAVVQTGAQNHQQQQQQQQDEELFVIGKLCAINPVPAVLEQAQSNSQLLPWQVPDNPAAAAAAGAGAAGGGSSTLLQQQQHQDGSSTATARVGSVRLWCGVTESVRELQLPTAALYSVLRPPPQQQQQHWQQCGGSSSGSGLAFLPGTCSISHLAAPSSSSFVGVQLQHLPLLVLAGLSQEDALVAAATQSPDPLAAAAAAWLPASGLSQQLQSVLLHNVQAGVLDGVPVPAAAAPGVLFSVAAAALVLGLKPSAQREQLGAGGEWLKGTDLADSLCQEFTGLLAWRERLLEDARSSRCLKTPLGRRLPFQLPPLGGVNQTAAAAKALKEARRSAVSLVLLSAIGDVQRLVVGCMQRACSAWQASGSSCRGGASDGCGSGAGSGSGRGVKAQAGSKQQGAGAVPAGSRSQNPSAGAAAAAGGAVSSGGALAPGRLLPGCQGAPSGFAVDGAAGGSGARPQTTRFVAVSGSQVVVEVPAGWALPLLECCARQVGREVAQLLGFAEAGEGGAVAEGAAAGSRLRLPFRWWWGGSLDVLQGNAFTA